MQETHSGMSQTQVMTSSSNSRESIYRPLGIHPNGQISSKRLPGSFYDAIIRALRRRRIPDHLLNQNREHHSPSEQYQAYARELFLLWYYRLRLLKQLERQLVFYHGQDESYRFMDAEDFDSWKELDRLIYEVAPVELQARITRQYSLVPAIKLPFLRPSPLEEELIRPSQLDDKAKYLNENEESTPTLHALLNALEAEALAPSDPNGQQLLADLASLCRPALREAVLKSLNRHFRWRCEDIPALQQRLLALAPQELRLGFEQIHICLPFIQNGSLAVALLREFVVLKSEMGLIQDRDGRPLSYQVHHEAGELEIRNAKGQKFVYQAEAGPGGYRRQVAKELTRVQEAIFIEMKRFLSHNLFGVARDRMELVGARYRLWSELMNFVYYQPESGHEDFPGFPNLEFNLRQGNPLISRFNLKTDLKKMLKGNRLREGLYLSALRLYRDAGEIDSRREARGIFTDLEQRFSFQLRHNHPEYQKLKKLEAELLMKETPLFELDLDPEQSVQSRLRRSQIEASINRIKTRLAERPRDARTFEWRYIFPEALNPDNGRFDGFDLVLLYPPEESLKEDLAATISLSQHLSREDAPLIGMVLPDDFFTHKTWRSIARSLKTAGSLEVVEEVGGAAYGELVTGKWLCLFEPKPQAKRKKK